MKTFVNWVSVAYCFTAIVLSAALFTACEKDEKEPEGQKNTQVTVDNAIGTWMCVSSIDSYGGERYSGLLVGVQITINADGTYTSTSSNFGRSGTYVMNASTFTAKNNAGDTFVLTADVTNDRMTWQGTSSTGVTFSYVFIRE